MAPFGGDVPALVAQGALEAVGGPAGLAEDVDIEGVEGGIRVASQVREALGDVAGDEVAALVDPVGLVQPVPLLVGLVDEGLGEGVGDGVGLGGVDVDGEVAVPPLAFLTRVLRSSRPPARWL